MPRPHQTAKPPHRSQRKQATEVSALNAGFPIVSRICLRLAWTGHDAFAVDGTVSQHAFRLIGTFMQFLQALLCHGAIRQRVLMIFRYEIYDPTREQTYHTQVRDDFYQKVQSLLNRPQAVKTGRMFLVQPPRSPPHRSLEIVLRLTLPCRRFFGQIKM
jgi:hypothetical protein